MSWNELFPKKRRKLKTHLSQWEKQIHSALARKLPPPPLFFDTRSFRDWIQISLQSKRFWLVQCSVRLTQLINYSITYKKKFFSHLPYLLCFYIVHINTVSKKLHLSLPLKFFRGESWLIESKLHSKENSQLIGKKSEGKKKYFIDKPLIC